MTSLNEPALEKALRALLELRWSDMHGEPNRKLDVDLTKEIAETAITAYLEAVGDGWEPIDTAPKDRELLLFGHQKQHHLIRRDEPFVFTGYWDRLDEAWCATGSTYRGPFYNPTHWRPLPAPPQEGE